MARISNTDTGTDAALPATPAMARALATIKSQAPYLSEADAHTAMDRALTTLRTNLPSGVTEEQYHTFAIIKGGSGDSQKAQGSSNGCAAETKVMSTKSE
mmetsp:Transcript_34871/g.84840  ORF Transcript_34871/g.84840 Transcript_34871/m.84840 type:complete len:100 (+) Transcript_34871:1058-1357(+)